MKWNFARCLLPVGFLAAMSAAGCHVHRGASIDSLAGEAGPSPELPETAYHIRVLGDSEPSVCIVTQFTPEIYHYANITTPNHRSYAARHGYRYTAFVNRLTDEFNIPDHDSNVFRDGLYWQSFAALRQVLAEQEVVDKNDRCAWLMWVDADVVFTDLNRSATAMLDRWAGQGGFDLADKDVILSREQWQQQQLINAGVFLLRNNDAGRQFVRAVIDKFSTYGHSCCPEQRAIHAWAFGGDLAWNVHDFEGSLANLRPNVAMLPQRAMNSFRGWDYDDREEGTKPLWEWQSGDFIAHFVGPKDAHHSARFEEMQRAASEAETMGWLGPAENHD